MENGLSHDNVLCLLQDRYGLVWIGTSNGLNCYYGNDNKVFRNDGKDAIDALPSNLVTALFDASPDTLWVGTGTGLCLHNRSTGAFVPFEAKTAYGVQISCEVRCLLRGIDGAVWIGTMGQGLFRYDGTCLKQFISDISFVTDMAVDTVGNIYVASKGHLLRVYSSQGVLKSSISVDSSILSLCYADGRIYIGSETAVYCKGQGEFILRHIHNARSIITDPDGNLFIGTDNGLYFKRHNADQYIRIDDVSTQSGLSNLQITAMMRDYDGGIWVGTAGGGVNYMTEQAMAFQPYYLPQSYVGNQKEIVSALCEGPDKTLYVGTNRGVYVLDEKNRTLQPYAPIKDCRVDVYSLWMEGTCLWISTNVNGLMTIDTQTGKVRLYVHGQQFGQKVLNAEYVNVVLRGSNGLLYIGTDNGLWRLDESTGSFEQESTVGAMIEVKDLCEDHAGNLWIATSQNGIYRYTLGNGHWRHYRCKPKASEGYLFSNGVNVLELDDEERLWIGTDGNGLGLYDLEADSFIRPKESGLMDMIPAGNVVKNIESDDRGDLWAIDEKGLTCYVMNGQRAVRTWTADNGLAVGNFGRRALLRLSDGRMVVGGEDGMVMFNPNRLMSDKNAPVARVVGISFPYGWRRKADDTLPNYRLMAFLPNELRLPYECGSFQLSFASTNYDSPGKTLYRYSFGKERKRNDWTQASNVYTASFTDLSPGTYYLYVEASNADGVWSEHPLEMTIIICPPWWMGTVARILYVLAGLGIVAGAAWAWNTYVKRKYRNRMKVAETKRQEEMYRQKINFFVNLVHEIRTPLSLIRLPLEQIIESGGQSEENTRLLALVDRNVDYLLNVSNQLLDLQRLENGDNLTLQLEACDAGLLADSLAVQFSEAAELKGIAFDLERPESPVQAVIDRDKVYKILVNLVSNALKYARTYIVVSLRLEADQVLCWMVDDDGPGIPSSEREKIFATFYRVENATEVSPMGTGIGLSYARALAMRHGGELSVTDNPQGGARFILTIPSRTECVEDSNMELPVEEQVVASDMSSEETADVSQYCVLIVEDNAELLQLTATALSRWFRMRKAVNGQMALEMLEEDDCDVDVVVSDVMMPVMDGLELCRNVKQNINTSHIPFIMLTAKTTLEAKVEGLTCGADAYVEKPFSIRQLKSQIDNLIRLRQAFHRLMDQNKMPDGMQSDMKNLLSERDQEFVMHMDQYISEHMASDISIDELAETMGMSRSNFYRKMKALTGLSPADYLKLVRMNRASELLRKGVRVNEVMSMVGFNSASYFAKCFKARFGSSPKDFMSSQKDGSSQE